MFVICSAKDENRCGIEDSSKKYRQAKAWAGIKQVQQSPACVYLFGIELPILEKNHSRCDTDV